MSLYLDTSLIVALLTPDAFSERAERFVTREGDFLIVSNFAAAEFASVISRRVRTGAFTIADAWFALSNFDVWQAAWAQQVEITASDISSAVSYLRRLDLALLAPDAVHIAVAERLGAILVTFDQRMGTAAQTVGITVAEP